MTPHTTSHDAPAAIQVDTTAFAVFGMHEVNGETIDAAIAAAGDALVCVFALSFRTMRTKRMVRTLPRAAQAMTAALAAARRSS